ncbi:sulfatase [Halalkalibacter sp. APA_J-10(15)]|uniref:sulfatase family protein n=1 Tax=Halalkalibacter sp. APA_J-10(15) TaxID=2933805 RepID=UPI001FF5E8B7|nr:sulfatase [Halalkalibacter sp. APA_J-10(15)]MCK0471721.1 sulfatase-like hydrolase/transferase [Halalkalibacter sp. APA_J-10(15)]
MRVLFLDLDSVSPRHLGCYGYERNTSPNIDKVAKKGVRFTNYYTSDAPCAPSRTALMSGQFGLRNGLVGHGGTAGDMRHEGVDRTIFGRLSVGGSLPSFLQLGAGLNTTLISPFPQRHATYNFYAGFNEIINTGKFGMESAEQVSPVVHDWVERNAEKDDWFLYVNYWDAHTPYRAPEDFGNPFANEPLPSWANEETLEKHRKEVGPHTVHELVIDHQNETYTNVESDQFPRSPGEIKTMDDLRVMIDGYDCGIRYVDDHVGQLFELLELKGILEDTIIIVSADHGENMGQLGIYGEHGTADDGTCRIPMIISWPGMKEGHVDDGLHYHLDLPVTLAEMLDIPPCPDWDGKSFASVLKEGKECGRDYVVMSQCAHVAQRSVRFGDWLYMRTYHDGYHLFDKEMLYNIKQDPREENNVAAQNKDVCMQAVYYLHEWHDEMMFRSRNDVDPLWTVIKEGGPFHAKGFLKNYGERLVQTGREEKFNELKKRHPNEFPEEADHKRLEFDNLMRSRLF